MAMNSFEDLKVWQLSRRFAGEIYLITKRESFSKDYGLSNQIQRAAVSIVSNIAEGHERASKAEFNRFLLIAKGSCAEVKTQLYLALDIGYLDKSTFDRLYETSNQIARMIGGLRRTLK
jgi:four helix bundle protein